MKEIRMTSSFAGMVNMPAGSIQTMGDEQAARFVELGHAVYTEPEEPTKVEPTKVERRSKRTVKAKEKR